MLLLVDSGSLGYYFDTKIIPESESLMLNIENLDTPRKVSTTGKNVLLYWGTRLITCWIWLCTIGCYRSVEVSRILLSQSGIVLHQSFMTDQACTKMLDLIISQAGTQTKPPQAGRDKIKMKWWSGTVQRSWSPESQSIRNVNANQNMHDAIRITPLDLYVEWTIASRRPLLLTVDKFITENLT